MWPNIQEIADEAEHVTKFVFISDNAVAESVLYRYPTYRDRTVICCSTQSGCPVGCRFCGAGDNFVRSLNADEIVAQVDYCLEKTGISASRIGRLQIMFMSMGEPMLNVKQLVPALRTLYAKYPHASLLISTSAPAVDYAPIFAVSAEIPTVGLQFSVHESTDAARDALIPFTRKLSLADISTTGEMWHAATGRHPFFNYCAHDGNSAPEDAARLLALFDPAVFKATVSVICERESGKAVTHERQRDLAVDFGNLLVSRGYDVRVFDPAGQDTIGGGCGQLWFVQDWMRSNPGKARKSVGHGLPSRHAPTRCTTCGTTCASGTTCTDCGA